MKVLDVNTLKPLNPGDFGYDLTDAVAVAVQMPLVWKVDDYTWFIAYDFDEACYAARQMGHDVDLESNTPLTAEEMSEHQYQRDDGSVVSFMTEYKRHMSEGGEVPALFASELI